MTNNLQLFNLETMSGVFSGVRTLVFQRLHLQLGKAPQWAQLSWYEDPPACVLTLSTQCAVAGATEAEALLRIENPFEGDLLDALQQSLGENQRTLQACGSCHFWQKGRETTVDGLPTGVCNWKPLDAPAKQNIVSTAIIEQSGLALDCMHWQTRTYANDFASEAAPSSAILEKPASEEERTLKQTRVVDRIREWFGGKQPNATDADNSSINILERSGVGAGTEPCFACNGRLANLGAMTVESAEGDKQTYSVWRCRSCYTFYLNRWIDRWERLDTLETVETHYRIAPAEALLALEQIQAKPGSDHPRLRAERADERTWFETLIQDRDPISHQVKQGR